MNQDLLRVFETESDYDSAKPDFVYPTVSYVRDVDEVYYMDKPLLPMIDTTGYATEFVDGQYYPQEAALFSTIYSTFYPEVWDGGRQKIFIKNGNMWLGMNMVDTEPIDISHEKLWIDYLSKITQDDTIELMNGYFQLGFLSISFSNGYAGAVPM